MRPCCKAGCKSNATVFMVTPDGYEIPFCNLHAEIAAVEHGYQLSSRISDEFLDS